MRAAARLLIQNAATAIVAASDLAAAAALRECRALKLAVPQQVSVVGWGDSELARCLDPWADLDTRPSTRRRPGRRRIPDRGHGRPWFRVAGPAAEAGHPRFDRPRADLTSDAVPRGTGGPIRLAIVYLTKVARRRDYPADRPVKSRPPPISGAWAAFFRRLWLGRGPSRQGTGGQCRPP